MAFKPGEGGRPKGARNKAHQEAQDWCARLIDTPAYRRSLQQRLIDGKLAPAMEALLWHYAKGKPAETILTPDAPAVPQSVTYVLTVQA